MGFPRTSASQAFKQDYAQRPKIGFLGVLIPLKCLGRHVRRATQKAASSFSVLKEATEAPIGYLHLPVFEEDVGWLDVPVDDRFLLGCDHRIEDLTANAS